MSIYKNVNGGLVIQAVDQAGYLFTQTYYFYTQREAKALYREALAKQNASYIWAKTA